MQCEIDLICVCSTIIWVQFLKVSNIFLNFPNILRGVKVRYSLICVERVIMCYWVNLSLHYHKFINNWAWYFWAVDGWSCHCVSDSDRTARHLLQTRKCCYLSILNTFRHTSWRNSSVTMNAALPSGTILILSLWRSRAFSCVSVCLSIWLMFLLTLSLIRQTC